MSVSLPSSTTNNSSISVDRPLVPDAGPGPLVPGPVFDRAVKKLRAAAEEQVLKKLDSPIQIDEEAGKMRVQISFPDFDQKDIRVEVAGQYLRVFSGPKTETTLNRISNDFLMVTSQRGISHSMLIPDGVKIDPKNAHLQVSKDILTISCPCVVQKPGENLAQVKQKTPEKQNLGIEKRYTHKFSCRYTDVTNSSVRKINGVYPISFQRHVGSIPKQDLPATQSSRIPSGSNLVSLFKSKMAQTLEIKEAETAYLDTIFHSNPFSD